eukprot:g2350.t1
MQTVENRDLFSEWDCWSSSGEQTVVYYKPPDLKTDEQYSKIHLQFQKEQERGKASCTGAREVIKTISRGKKHTVVDDYCFKSAGEGDKSYLPSFSNSHFDCVPTVMFSRSFWKLLDKFRHGIPLTKTSNNDVQ